MSAPPATVECPKCGFKGLNHDQCDRCGIIFDRMHTVVDTAPLGAAMVAAREAYLAQRAAARGPAAPSGPSVEVSPDARTIADVPRVIANRPGLAGAAGLLDRVKVNPHASTMPHVAPVAAPPPSSPTRMAGIDMVAPDRPKSRTGLLLTLLAIALVGWGFSELQQRRERRISAAAPLPTGAAATTPAAPTIPAQDFSLAARTLLADLRRDFALVEDAATATENLRAARARLDLLLQQRPSVRLSPLQRSAFDRGLTALDEFLRDRVPAAIEKARAAVGRAEPTDPTHFDAAERAFLDADRAPPLAD